MPLPQPVPALNNPDIAQENAADELHAVQLLEVGEAGHNQRVDNFLFSRLKGVPKSRIYRIIRKGEVRVNKKRVKADSRLHSGDQVRVPPLRIAEQPPVPRPGASLVQLLENSVLYQDNELLVINKPQGVAVHMGSGLQIGVIEALRWMQVDGGEGKEEFLELGHRLDRATSGCLVIARTPAMLKHLQREFKERRVSKHYQAIVHGYWPDEVVRVNAPLRKNEVTAGERIVIVDPEGKPAVTDFRVLQRLRNSTLIEARPLTGRTHQIRVHCQHAGHPIVGDDKYTSTANLLPQVRSLCLHAAAITFELPGGRQFSQSAPLQQPMQELIAKLAS